MTTLAEFLLAQIAEDEAAVRRAMSDLDPVDQGDPIELGDDPWPSHVTFAERFTPARVLAECDAKRRIVERCGWAAEDSQDWRKDYDMYHAGETAWDTLRDLASVYADRPGYREEWRP